LLALGQIRLLLIDSLTNFSNSTRRSVAVPY
jgi:hypothetical protein